MGKISFYGGVNLHRIQVENDILTEEYKTRISDTGKSGGEWNNNTVMLANMETSVNGNGIDVQFNNILRFKVYKKIGKDNPKPYKVYETSNNNERLIEDFAVGDDCEYKYYVYPVCHNTFNDVDVECYGTPVESDYIRLDSGVLSIYELIRDEHDDRAYHINTKEIWKLRANLEDSGTTLNTNKLFSDTQSQYQQETASYRVHKSKSVSALIGDFDCSTGEFSDSFEKLEAWDKFCSNGTLKLLVDIRGRMMIGDIDNNPQIQYDNDVAKISFSFIELSDIDNVSIWGRAVTIDDLNGYTLIDCSVSDYNFVLEGFDYNIDILGDLTFRLLKER